MSDTTAGWQQHKIGVVCFLTSSVLEPGYCTRVQFNAAQEPRPLLLVHFAAVPDANSDRVRAAKKAAATRTTFKNVRHLNGFVVRLSRTRRRGPPDKQ